MSQIAVIGAGAWGTALSIVLGRKGGHRIRLWVFEKEVRESIAARRVNELFLPGQSIPDSVSPTGDLEEAIRNAEIVVSVMPSQHSRRLFQDMRPHLKREMLLVSATKGVEEKTLLRMTEVISQIIRRDSFLPRLGALSGPSFAKEVARGDPTAITIASKDPDLAGTVQREFSDPRFRVYTNDDVIGVELGGSLKNVIAIAAGVCDGLGLGHNSIAALITRGLAEITRLVVACGGRQETMSGLAGLGDLVLTSYGSLSRNRRVGVALGQGKKIDEVLSSMRMVAEGVKTARSTVALARKLNIEMPIAEKMYSVLYEDLRPQDAIDDLMERKLKEE